MVKVADSATLVIFGKFLLRIYEFILDCKFYIKILLTYSIQKNPIHILSSHRNICFYQALGSLY